MLMNKLLTGIGGEEKLYSDDVFQSFVRTGTGADVTVTTGIDMTKGYMLWSKGRSGATNHAIYDSARGVTLDLVSNSTAAQTTQTTGLKSVSATGHTIGSLAKMNTSSATYVDFIFRRATKFFDVVTYTGNGAGGRQIPHNLGIAPGMVIVKSTNAADDWYVYHRSTTSDGGMYLNTTAAKTTSGTWWNNTEPTTTNFTVGSGANTNTNGITYVAYLFAHDTSTDGIIQCGSFTTDASGNATVNLGWEPQFVMVKSSSSGRDWQIVDTMRGLSTDQSIAKTLRPNLANAEGSTLLSAISATGFNVSDAASTTYIYLAIRRPNKPPTTGTQVYNAITRTGTGAAATVTGVGFATDLVITLPRSLGFYKGFVDKLRGVGSGSTKYLNTTDTSAESSVGAVNSLDMDGFTLYGDSVGFSNASSYTYCFECFRRAPGVFSILCDTGTGSAHAIDHNLGSVPELIIRKGRSGATQWEVYFASLGNTKKLVLNSTAGEATDTTAWNSTTPTSTQITVGTGANVNTSSATYVTYLFATLPGISKVFSFTGNGTNQNIECGFSTGARFVLLKRTDSTGNWLVADATRGLVSGNDPSLALNSTAAEVTSVDWIDPYAGGFNIVQESTNNANVNNATYIGLAIA